MESYTLLNFLTLRANNMDIGMDIGSKAMTIPSPAVKAFCLMGALGVSYRLMPFGYRLICGVWNYLKTWVNESKYLNPPNMSQKK